MIQIGILIAVFWVIQAACACVFKFGSLDENAKWFWPSFVIANLIGVPSTLLFMWALKGFASPNVGLGICCGGAFAASQVALVLIFRAPMTPVQILGAAAIAAGIVAMCLGAPAPAKTHAASPPAAVASAAAPADSR